MKDKTVWKNIAAGLLGTLVILSAMLVGVHQRSQNIAANQAAEVTATKVFTKNVVSVEFDDVLRGTGFFIDRDHVVTNWHVACRTSTLPDSVRGAISKRKWAIADVWCSEYFDIAVLTTVLPNIDTYLLHPDRTPKLFQEVESFGAGYGRWSWKQGRVTLATAPMFPNQGPLLGISMSINPGDSGSPLLTPDGRWVGVINSTRGTAVGFGFIPSSNLGFAIPGDGVRRALMEFLRRGTYGKPHS